MVYDGANLTMTLTDTVTAGSVTEVFPVNIPSVIGGTQLMSVSPGERRGSLNAERLVVDILRWREHVRSHVQPGRRNLFIRNKL